MSCSVCKPITRPLRLRYHLLTRRIIAHHAPLQECLINCYIRADSYSIRLQKHNKYRQSHQSSAAFCLRRQISPGMASQSPFLELPGELRNMVYRELAREDIKVCLVTAHGIAISQPLGTVCKQVRAEFSSILVDIHPGITTGIIPVSVNSFVLDLGSITPRKLSAKMIIVSTHAAKNGINDLQIRYITSHAA